MRAEVAVSLPIPGSVPVKTDSASGIVNDPNDWSRDIGDPRYVLDLLARVVTVSVETVKIVDALPALAIQYLAMVIIGGLDSIPGAIVGAFIVTMVPTLCTNLLRGSLGASATIKGPQIALIIYGALVIIFVTSSAGGIVGWFRSGSALLRQKIGRSCESES